MKIANSASTVKECEMALLCIRKPSEPHTSISVSEPDPHYIESKEYLVVYTFNGTVQWFEHISKLSSMFIWKVTLPLRLFSRGTVQHFSLRKSIIPLQALEVFWIFVMFSNYHLKYNQEHCGGWKMRDSTLKQDIVRYFEVESSVRRSRSNLPLSQIVHMWKRRRKKGDGNKS